ncbi:TDT family transporter [Barrientosiimonas humi]
MLTVTTARPQTGAAPAPALPKTGPQWFGSVMGTSILATLLQLHHDRLPGATYAARTLLLVSWVVCLGLSIGFARRCLTTPGTLASTLRDPKVLVTWGMVSMGVLSAGSATATVVPGWVPRLTDLSWRVDEVTWVLGTLLGVGTAIGFLLVLLRRDIGEPAMTWGLAVVSPMVSATVGAGIAHRLGDPWRTGLVLASSLCFVVALLLGAVIFAVAYHHHWRVRPLTPVMAPSAWIPLGIVGQSTAAAQVLVTAATPELTRGAATALRGIVNAYGLVLLVVGAGLVAWAVWQTLRGFAARMPFTPGWWAMTFPVGTLSLGAYQLAAGTGSGALSLLGVVVCVGLVGTWSLCAGATARALLRSSRAPAGSAR